MKGSEETARTALLIGEDGLARLRASRVAVFGIGGVGGYVCEALARAGVGALDLFDHDTVSLSNINRQVIALHSTVGREKTEVMRERILDINPDCRVTIHPVFYLPENADEYPLDGYSYIADAVDTVAAKIELAVRARAAGVPIISAMGTGNRLDAAGFEVTDLFRTSGCPLARTMRHELRARGILSLTVVCSSSASIPPRGGVAVPADGGKRTVGSVSFVPPVAGLLMAGEIIRALSGNAEKQQKTEKRE